MGHSVAKRYFSTFRPTQKRSGWRISSASEHKLRLVPGPSTLQDWGIEVKAECEPETAEIPEGYKAAISLLRSLRNVSEEEAQRQRQSWELLKHDLDENKYH